MSVRGHSGLHSGLMHLPAVTAITAVVSAVTVVNQVHVTEVAVVVGVTVARSTSNSV